MTGVRAKPGLANVHVPCKRFGTGSASSGLTTHASTRLSEGCLQRSSDTGSAEGTELEYRCYGRLSESFPTSDVCARKTGCEKECSEFLMPGDGGHSPVGIRSGSRKAWQHYRNQPSDPKGDRTCPPQLSLLSPLSRRRYFCRIAATGYVEAVEWSDFGIYGLGWLRLL